MVSLERALGRGRGGARPVAAVRPVALPRAAAALVAVALAAGAGALLHADGAARPTRADLAAARRRAARLESEYALAATRRPYIVLDLASGVVRYRLMGMTMREIPVGPVDVAGLVADDGAAAGSPARLAGIFTMTEKEGDPRLNPLSPEQVEAGADDENVAAVFAPEPPKTYRLTFRQPVAVVVAAEEPRTGVKGIGTWLRHTAGRLFGRRDKGAAALRVALRLEPAIASEFWRSVVPDQRWLLVPPDGLALPQAGQEPPPKAKGPRAAPAAPARKPKSPEPAEGVPFRIPPPIEPPGANGGGEAGDPPPAPGTAPDPPPPSPPPPAQPADGGVAPPARPPGRPPGPTGARGVPGGA